MTPHLVEEGGSMAKAEKLTLVFLIVATAGRLRLKLGPHLV